VKYHGLFFAYTFNKFEKRRAILLPGAIGLEEGIYTSTLYLPSKKKAALIV